MSFRPEDDDMCQMHGWKQLRFFFFAYEPQRNARRRRDFTDSFEPLLYKEQTDVIKWIL